MTKNRIWLNSTELSLNLVKLRFIQLNLGKKGLCHTTIYPLRKLEKIRHFTPLYPLKSMSLAMSGRDFDQLTILLILLFH